MRQPSKVTKLLTLNYHFLSVVNDVKPSKGIFKEWVIKKSHREIQSGMKVDKPLP